MQTPAQFVLSTVLISAAMACTSKSAPPIATADSDAAAVAPPAKPDAATPLESARALPQRFKAGEVVDPRNLDPNDPLRRILQANTPQADDHKDEVANLDNAPKKPLEGTYNGKVKFEKLQIECTDTGYRMRLTPAKDGDKNSVSFPLTKEPTVGINFGAPTEARDALLSIDGVTWRLQHSWVVDFKTYDKTAPFKGKDAVLGHASGRLIWVAFGVHGVKITRIAGTFANAPIKAFANCVPNH